jgi:hypothetical protein
LAEERLQRGILAFGRRQQWAVVAVGVAAGAGALSDLPVDPMLVTDSASYLTFSPVRPHGYPLFLAAYREFAPNLAYLPAAQGVLAVASVTFLSVAVGWRLASFPAALVVFALLWWHFDPSAAYQLMSEALYAPALTGGAASFVLYAMRKRPGWLVLAGTCVGLAMVSRSIGYALVPALLLGVLVAEGLGVRTALRRLAISLVPVALLGGAAAASNFVQNGSFAIGSTGGVSLLGKALVLARPLPDGRFAEVAWLARPAEQVREALDRTPDLMLRALLARQYYEYLRWELAWPRFLETWPEWSRAGVAERARLASSLAWAQLRADPLGYARLAATDYLALWAMPRHLTDAEHERMVNVLESLGELVFLSDFRRTEEGALEYYQIVPPPRAAAAVWGGRALAALFWAVSLPTLFLLAKPRLARCVPDLVFLVAAVHVSYAVTALNEAAIERYVAATWPPLVAACVLGPTLLVRLWREARQIAG